MELKQTIEMMESTDYKERYKAEYYQTAIRYNKLRAMCDSWDNGTLPFKPTCPRSTYDLQLKFMFEYLAILELRAVVEHIELDKLGE